MAKFASFYNSLKKSTRLTVTSCAGFILLTLLVLIFFVMFPITPSEKIMTSIGRESIHHSNDGGEGINAVPEVMTTDASAATATANLTAPT